MPGPCNSKKRRQQQAKKEKALKAKRAPDSQVSTTASASSTASKPPEECDDGSNVTHKVVIHRAFESEVLAEEPLVYVTGKEKTVKVPLGPFSLDSEEPFIVNPGNGPRVKNVSAYLSSFFCIPTSKEDPACAAFLAADALKSLALVLPRELAIITWFNKTRKVGRICPACQRIYKQGDTLLDPVSNEPVDPYHPSTPKQLLREQEISGICSSACFLLASYSSHPHVAEVTRGAWGRYEDEIDNDVSNMLGATDLTTATMILDGPSCWKDLAGDGEQFTDQGLGRMMRLTRHGDLGLRLFERSG